MPRPRKQEAEAYKFPSSGRVNNPTSETALGLGAEDIQEQTIPEPEPEERLRHPRLQWNRGEQTDHSRTFGPLYIHDKVSAEQFLGSLLKDKTQGDMFATFNGLPEDASAKPYEYSGHWTNRLIRATAQRAMASLLYKDGMRGKVNLIYMDPPYNQSFRSNFQAAADSPETQEEWDDLPNDPMLIKAFRDTYRDGVHSYLDGLYEQLTLGRELLAENGSFIVQIGPDNVHEVVLLMSEVFDRENHVATIPYRTTTNPSTRLLPEIGNWLIWFAKDKETVKYHQIYTGAKTRRDIMDLWQNKVWYEDQPGTRRTLSRAEKDNPEQIPKEGRLLTTLPCHSSSTSSTGRSDPLYLHKGNTSCNEHSKAWDNHTCTKECDGTNNECPLGKKCGPKCHADIYTCPENSHWRVSHRGLQLLHQRGRLNEGRNIQWKQYEDEVLGRSLNAIWENSGVVADKQYIVETPPKVLERCLLMTTDPGDLVLDLTCGSGAMPFQAERWGRRWIAIDVAQVSIAIARERILTSTYPYHLLKDSPEGDKLDHEMEQALLPPEKQAPFAPKDSYGNDPAKGFVTERQMRVSAATLAYGYDDEEPIRHPDRTIKGRNKVRVASPFTVESDSPYRSVAPGGSPDQGNELDVETVLQNQGFNINGHQEPDAVTDRITSSLETAGIGQPGRGRYKVDNLAASEIPDVTHTGTLVDPNGERHPAYFYIGREDEVISSVQTRNAAFAVTNADPTCRHVVMVGFGRDGDVHSVGKYRPNMTILQVATNRDLQLPWLKEDKTDSAFTIISEPEVRLHEQPDGKIRLEVVGLNAFNPKTGVVEPPSTRQVMGIMVDTEYDTQSFRARLMNVQQVKRNQRTIRNLRAALRREIDDEKWEQMQSTTTIPFELPEPGVKIAVKVIDQTGMEHMTVIDDPRQVLSAQQSKPEQQATK